MNQKPNVGKLLLCFFLVIGLIAITRFTDLKPHWGSLEMRTNATITVSGTAKKEQVNQIANFTASVESIEETKEEALNKTTEAMNQLIAKVKELGIKTEDIQTQNASVYQETEYVPMSEPTTLIYPQPERGDARKGDWRANNSVNIKLREIDKADALLAILNNSGANYVYGPDFSIDDVETSSNELLAEAVVNAREKAEKIATANNQRVGKILSLVEGNSYPIYANYKSVMPLAGGGSELAMDANLEPGSSTTSKTVTVTFELN